MSNEVLIKTASVNLPVETIDSIIDVNDKRILVPIEEAAERFANKEIDRIKTMNTNIKMDDVFLNQKYVQAENIEFKHGMYSIGRIQKKKVGKTNKLKYFMIKVQFHDGKQIEFVVPSYVKFYSMQRGQFIPIEYMRGRDIMMDYSGRMAQYVDDDTVELTDFKPEEYWNIKIFYNPDREANFYLNGLLASVSYNNFNIQDSGIYEDDSVENEEEIKNAEQEEDKENE